MKFFNNFHKGDIDKDYQKSLKDLTSVLNL